MSGQDELIHGLFARRAAEFPDAPAVIQGALRVSYRELDALAEELAGRLAGQGIGPGSLVPVLLPRSIQLVTAFLAVLKCGAAYAALDPRWPQERLDRLVGQLGSPVVVTEGEAPAGRQAVAPARPGQPLPAA
ncbi:AMP-binding protein, partial [Kitasatospora sp. LaBMicrA B282]|uniref:AMP-binding protein n=1 Tax=Kitasatospora sp. LaBMicrA B282 TaxID=3420949 RepID=UPI003D0BD043